MCILFRNQLISSSSYLPLLIYLSSSWLSPSSDFDFILIVFAYFGFVLFVLLKCRHPVYYRHLSYHHPNLFRLISLCFICHLPLLMNLHLLLPSSYLACVLVFILFITVIWSILSDYVSACLALISFALLTCLHLIYYRHLSYHHPISFRFLPMFYLFCALLMNLHLVSPSSYLACLIVFIPFLPSSG